MLVEIDKVIVNDRIRKDFGNIDELAQDIKDNGLINPPVVTPEFELIAGERRYRAMKTLGWQQIEVRIMSVQDALHKLKLEISENENRKDFSFNEKMTWAELLKEEYGKIAKENSLKGIRQEKCDKIGRVDSLVAKEVGFGSKDTYRQAEYIYQNADEEMIKQLDDGKLSINKAYNTLKDKARELESKAIQLEQEKQQLQSELQHEKSKQPVVETKTVETIIDNTDYEAMANLDKLKKELESKTKLYNLIVEKEKSHESLMMAYKQDSEDYNKLKRELELLAKKKTDLSRSLNSATELTGLIYEVERFIKEKLAPIRYSRALIDESNNWIVQKNIKEIVTVVQNWCDEMNEYLVDKNCDIINVEVI